MKTQFQAVDKVIISRSIEDDLDRYLDAVADATAIFREAVDGYLQTDKDGSCWQQARKITEKMRTLDDLQQHLETGVYSQASAGNLISGMVDPMTGVSHLLKDMKRQITSFAVESDPSRSGVCIPQHLVPDMLQLTDEVCAAVDVLVAGYRPSLQWWKEAPSGDEDRGVSWHESQADRLSMQLLKKIFGDDALEIEAKLTLARFVEEIDRVADHAEEIDRELCATRMAGQTTADARDSH